MFLYIKQQLNFSILGELYLKNRKVMADMNLIRHSSFERFLNLGKLVIYKEDNVSKVYKNETGRPSNNKGNLFPVDYKRFFFTMLSSQDKWNKVFDKFIEKVDELESQQTVKEVKSK